MLTAIQSFLVSRHIDGWLVHDFRSSSPIFARLFPGRRFTTRRLDLLIPAAGPPRLLSSRIDASSVHNLVFPGTHAPIQLELYMTWREYRDRLAAMLGTMRRVAMDYAPGGNLPVVSTVDAGTVELVRALGLEVVSSADVAQIAVAAWGDGAAAEHDRVSAIVDGIKNEAFGLIGRATAEGKTIHEHDVAQFIRDRFTGAGLEFPDGPIVAINAHAADPHYEPSATHPAQIKPGDWVLIDLWARRPGEEHIFSDITWTGFVPSGPTGECHRFQREIFDLVAAARDASLAAAQAAWRTGRPINGAELDDAARLTLERAGFAHAVRHRTGHSLSPGKLVHGLGMNLDNLETHDTRLMLPGTGFTIEPGLYLPDGDNALPAGCPGFGVRSEINVYVDPIQGPRVTSQVQREPMRAQASKK